MRNETKRTSKQARIVNRNGLVGKYLWKSLSSSVCLTECYRVGAGDGAGADADADSDAGAGVCLQ